MTPTSNSETLSLVSDGRSLEGLILIFLVTSVPSIRYIQMKIDQHHHSIVRIWK